MLKIKKVTSKSNVTNSKEYKNTKTGKTPYRNKSIVYTNLLDSTAQTPQTNQLTELLADNVTPGKTQNADPINIDDQNNGLTFV